MSRANYTDDCDDLWEHIMWRGAVASAIKGKRGQAFLRELVAALDAMPEKRLISAALVESGGVCAIGSVGLKRGLDMSALDPENYRQIADAFGISQAMVREIEYENDEAGWALTPEARWERMRAWAEQRIKRGEEG